MRNKNIYAEYRNEAKYAFVPAERGRFIRTHICAAFVPCSNCGVKRHKPCISSDGNMTVATCLARRETYRSQIVADSKKKLNSNGGRA